MPTQPQREAMLATIARLPAKLETALNGLTDDLLQFYAQHCQEHLAQIERLLTAKGW